MADNDSLNPANVEVSPGHPAAPYPLGGHAGPIAAVGHTVVLIVGIVALSILGKAQLSSMHREPDRLSTYGETAAMEVLLLGWVALGLRVRMIPFRSLFGHVTKGFHGIALDLGIAFLFWIGSLSILGTLGILWTGVEIAIHHRQAPSRASQALEPTPEEKQTVRQP